MTTKYIATNALSNSNTLIPNSNNASLIWKTLNGIINVYKPAGVGLNFIGKTIVGNLCRDLNNLNVRPPREIVCVEETNNGSYSVEIKPSYADHPLVVGPRHQIQDIRINATASIGRNTSGVLLFGINDGCRLASLLHKNKPTRAYHVMGKLGEATDNYFSDGKIVEKATFHRIRRSNIDTLLASLQAAHQKKMFELCGVSLQSQAAYELALKGPLRPADNKLPVVYGLKCIDFSPPHFTIELQCINEYEKYLMTLIHEIGYQLRSVAHCTKIRCIRHGHFTIDKSLLRRHWNVQGIRASIENSKSILEDHPYMLKQMNPNLT